MKTGVSVVRLGCDFVGHAQLKLQVSAIMRRAFGFCKIFFYGDPIEKWCGTILDDILYNVCISIYIVTILLVTYFWDGEVKTWPFRKVKWPPKIGGFLGHFESPGLFFVPRTGKESYKPGKPKALGLQKGKKNRENVLESRVFLVFFFWGLCEFFGEVKVFEVWVWTIQFI